MLVVPGERSADRITPGVAWCAAEPGPTCSTAETGPGSAEHGVKNRRIRAGTTRDVTRHNFEPSRPYRPNHWVGLTIMKFGMQRWQGALAVALLLGAGSLPAIAEAAAFGLAQGHLHRRPELRRERKSRRRGRRRAGSNRRPDQSRHRLEPARPGSRGGRRRQGAGRSESQASPEGRRRRPSWSSRRTKPTARPHCRSGNR